MTIELSDAFADGLALLGVIAGLAVGVILAGLAVRVGLRWLLYSLGVSDSRGANALRTHDPYDEDF